MPRSLKDALSRAPIETSNAPVERCPVKETTSGREDGRTFGSVPAGESLEETVAIALHQLDSFLCSAQAVGKRDSSENLLIRTSSLGVEDEWVKYTTAMAILWYELDAPDTNGETVKTRPGLRQLRMPAGPWRELQDVFFLLTSSQDFWQLGTDGHWRVQAAALSKVSDWTKLFIIRLRQVVPPEELGVWARVSLDGDTDRTKNSKTEYLTVKEVVDLVHESERTIRSRLKDGHLKNHGSGRRVLIARHEIASAGLTPKRSHSAKDTSCKAK